MNTRYATSVPPPAPLPIPLGQRRLGTEARPHTRKATITLTNNVKDEDIGGMGGANDRIDRGIVLMGGTLNLHGDRKHTWTKLAQTAASGSKHLDRISSGRV